MVGGRLHGRVAIVTGASRQRGIGAAICRALAREGADVFFTHWRPYDRLQPYGEDVGFAEAFAAELQGHGVRSAAMELNLAEPDAPDRLLAQVAGVLGRPSVLVNNATHCEEVDYQGLTAEILDAHCAVNVRGTCLLSARFVQQVEGCGGGRVINLVSGQDKSPEPGNLAYVATKGAISAFTRSLAAGVAGKRVTVNAVDPGPTDSGWMSDELRQELLTRCPMRRLGLPEDVARLVAFLASDEAAWITGQVIHSDGGFLELR